MRNLSYCAETVYTHDHDRFFLSLFVPAAGREGLLAVYALNVELAHVHRAVHEEMIGHIRYAWWQESLEAVAAGGRPREHPVLTALPQTMTAPCLKLVELYRAAYPDMPVDVALMEELSLMYIHAARPEAEAGWCRAKNVIGRHRARFGQKWNSWLYLKLIGAGIG